MDVKEAAEALNGSQYREEGSRPFFDNMKADGLVAVYGASDDLMEIDGAIFDEIGCYTGGTVYLTSNGLLLNKCINAGCPHYLREIKSAAKIEAVWCDPDVGSSWSYKTTIPHETFDVFEDGELYCRGIVFRLADVPA